MRHFLRNDVPNCAVASVAVVVKSWAAFVLFEDRFQDKSVESFSMILRAVAKGWKLLRLNCVLEQKKR